MYKNWWWLYCPVLLFILILLINTYLSSIGVEANTYINNMNYGSHYFINENKYYYKNLADFLLNHENGIIELGTVLILLPAVIFGFLIISLRDFFYSKIIIIWFLSLTLACIYFAGEEISWGQHFFSWNTPDYIKGINDQEETNIHNISSWFDQKPRLILELFVLIGGLIIPLITYFYGRNYKINECKYWIYPSYQLIPISILVILIKTFDRLDFLNYRYYIDELPLSIFQAFYFKIFYGIRINETQELFFAYFLMLYMLVSYKKIKYVKNSNL